MQFSASPHRFPFKEPLALAQQVGRRRFVFQDVHILVHHKNRHYTDAPK
jgi:hypothetical protein